MSNDKMREAFKASECLYAWALSPNSQPIEKIVEKFQIVRAALSQPPDSEPVYQLYSKLTGAWDDVGREEYDTAAHYRRRILYTSPQPAAQVPEGFALVPEYRCADDVVTALYRRFKQWSEAGFGPDDVTWCEVKADVMALINTAASIAEKREPAELPGMWDESDLIGGETE